MRYKSVVHIMLVHNYNLTSQVNTSYRVPDHQDSFQWHRMPFNLNHHPHSPSASSQQQHNAQQPPGAISGILQATQSLGSVGAPTGNLNNAISGRTPAGTDRLYSTSAVTQSSKPLSVNSTQIAPSSATGAMNQPPQFETPRRNRHPDELHLPPGGTPSQRGPLSPREYPTTGPHINLEQATPEGSQYQGGGQLPGSLQPGRPGAVSINTAPALPTAPQSMSQDHYATPSRSSALGLSHNYTKSSPAAGFDGQGYPPYSSTTPGTEQGQFTSPTTQKYTPAQRTISNTPLGLADIRPRADSSISDNLPGANPYSYDGVNATPTNSNYLAPWAIYAFDWCKWPAQSHDAGKLAVGSYLEDGHNFVSTCQVQGTKMVCRVEVTMLYQTSRGDKEQATKPDRAELSRCQLSSNVLTSSIQCV